MNNLKRLKGTATLVREIFSEHPDWNARQIYDRYLILIGDTNNAVTLNAVQKQVQVLKKRNQTRRDTGIDLPWSLDKTPDFPAEAIAAIFKVQSWLERAKDNPLVDIRGWNESYTDNTLATTVWPLTVEEANWISKLYKVEHRLTGPELLYRKTHKLPLIVSCQLSESPYDLWQAAKAYTDYHRLCDMAGIDFDTTRLDSALRSGFIGEAKWDLFSEYEKRQEKDG